MKALTICQPYAELIARNIKPIENRTWPTPYRGDLLIHAGKSTEWLDPQDVADYPTMLFGAVIAVARLVDCRHINQPKTWGAREYLAHHEHANGPWCFILEGVRRLPNPIRINGAQGLWIPPLQIVASVREQLSSSSAAHASHPSTGVGVP